MPFEIGRSQDTRTSDLTVGDRVRLGDTNLLVEVEVEVEVERDEAQTGDEALWGFGKAV